jgi:hypothetical protein
MFLGPKLNQSQDLFGSIEISVTFASDYSLLKHDGETGKNITIGFGALR